MTWAKQKGRDNVYTAMIEFLEKTTKKKTTKQKSLKLKITPLSIYASNCELGIFFGTLAAIYV